MKAELLNSQHVDRQEWDAFLLQSPQGMAYALTGYMDAIAPDWVGIVCRSHGKIQAVMPLNLRKKGPYTASLQPTFSQFWGAFLADQEHQPAWKEYNHKRRVVQSLLDAIPKEVRWFSHGFAPEFDYPFPFHWAGYQLKTRYTYRLELAPGVEALEAALSKDAQYSLRRAAEWEPQLRTAANTDALLRLEALNRQQGRPLIPAGSEGSLRRLGEWIIASGQGSLWVAGPEGGEVAALLTSRLGDKVSYLLSAVDPAHRSSGLMTLMLWQAIRQSAAEKRTLFDFEGSMMESIEAFFRDFSPRPAAYLQITKNTLPFPLRWIKK